MSDDDQIPIPPSFHAVHADARGRLQLPLAEFRARYELCEDLAQALVERAQAIRFDLGVTEADVLERIEQGLQPPAAGLDEAEAAWVITRLAELLDWPWAGRPQPEAGDRCRD
jgi:hypothetical protein